MNFAHAMQIAGGVAVACLYAGAVLGSGVLCFLAASRKLSLAIWEGFGPLGFLWMSFVVGQGVLGVVWLAIALNGSLKPSVVWTVCIVGWGALAGGAVLLRRHIAGAKPLPVGMTGPMARCTWYRGLVWAMTVIALFHGMMALLPPAVDDAVKLYLVWAKVVAAAQKLELQPFMHPFYALLPMQVEMHWAGLYAIASESAVTAWDYFCALSFLFGIGLLAWRLNEDRRIAVIAVLMMLSTPAFYAMMGGGKVDNASAQYGIAAFVWLLLWPRAGVQAGIFAGLCLGWAVASRYTNVIILPGLLLFGALIARDLSKGSGTEWPASDLRRQTFQLILGCGLAAALAGLPMLIKNWLLVGCPLAPQMGCDTASWSAIFRTHTAHLQNLTLLDFALYPFTWTFASRESMLGNISPLFLGFAPFLFFYYGTPIVKNTRAVGLAGLASLAAWFAIEPLVLFSRFLLIPLALLTIPLSAAVCAADREVQHRPTRWLIKLASVIVLLFLVFESRGVVHAGRYLMAIDSREDRYRNLNGYDVAIWLNAHVREGERVAVGNYNGHKYFVEPRLLLASESSEELQWLWEHGQWHYAPGGRIAPVAWLEAFWRFYLQRGFAYVIVSKEGVRDALSAWPKDLPNASVEVVMRGTLNDIVKLTR